MGGIISVVSKIHNLRVLEDLRKGIEISDGFLMTNSNYQVKRNFGNSTFNHYFGFLEYRNLFDSTIIYRIDNYNSEISNLDEFGLKLINSTLEDINKLDPYFWLMKDNSIYTENAFAIIEVNKKLHGYSNEINSYHSNASGEKTVTDFTKNEIREVITLALRGFKIGSQWSPVNKYNFHHSSNRLQRFLYFLSQARLLSHLPARILMYTCMLESLFSTNRKNIKQDLIQRVSKFLDKDYKSLIKNIYNIRSIVVHGDIVPSKYNDYNVHVEISKETDTILREIYLKIFMDDHLVSLFSKKPDSDIENYFKK